MEMFRENREKVCKELERATTLGSVILLEGGSDISWYDTDVDYVFKQVGGHSFVYLFSGSNNNSFLFPGIVLYVLVWCHGTRLLWTD